MSDAIERINAALESRYRIERELGAGGMATVYLAEDVRHHRQVAVKVLRPDLAATLGPDRFLREIELAAQLTHPHILPLHDSGEADGFLFYVMPYIKGESLADKIRREGELPIDETVRLLRDVIDGLAHAHAEGVVHRDIKPDNVLLSGRHAVVTDFGIAKAVSEATGRQTLTTAGVALGTPTYMAPEQAVADPHIDHRADIYAVGALAYEMLTGQPPFVGATPQAVLAAHVTEPARPISETRASVPPALETLIMRCLEKKAADRWQSAEDMLPHLDTAATPSGGVTPTDTRPLTVAPPPVARPAARRMALVVGAAVVVGAIGWLLVGRGGRAPVHLDANAIAVLPFRVTSSSLSDWREGMVDYLHGKLTGEAGPRAVDPRSLMSAWRSAVSDPATDLSLEGSLEVAAALGAGQVLLGSFVGTGDRITLNATIHRVPGGRPIADASVPGSTDSVLTMIDALVGQLLTLGAGEGQARLSGLSTNVAAVMEYLQGRQAAREGRYLDAFVHHRTALEVDSGFALAAFELIRTGDISGNTNVDVEFPVRVHAWSMRDQLSPRDRAAMVAYFGRNFPGFTTLVDFIEDAERSVELAPDDAAAWGTLGTYRQVYADYLGDSAGLDRAAAVLDSAIALDSSASLAIDTRLRLAIQMGQMDLVNRLTDHYLRVDSLGEYSEFVEWRSAVALGDEDRLARVRERLGTTTQISLTRIGYWTVYRGLPLDDWIAATRRFAERAVTGRATEQAMEQRRKIAAVQGRVSVAIAISDSLRDAGFFVSSINDMLVMQALLENGYEDAADRVVQSIEDTLATAFGEAVTILEEPVWPRFNAECAREVWKLQQRDTSTVHASIRFMDQAVDRYTLLPVCPLLLKTMLASVRGAGVQEALEALDAYMVTDDPGLVTAPIQLASVVSARLHEHAGDLDAALAAIRRRQIGGPAPGQQIAMPAMLREEGRLAALAGDTTRAIDAYQHYLTVRTDPEPVLQAEVEEVRSALAALVGERRR